MLDRNLEFLLKIKNLLSVYFEESLTVENFLYCHYLNTDYLFEDRFARQSYKLNHFVCQMN